MYWLTVHGDVYTCAYRDADQCALSLEIKKNPNNNKKNK